MLATLATTSFFLAVIQQSSSMIVSLSLLTTNMYSLIFAIFLFDNEVRSKFIAIFTSIHNAVHFSVFNIGRICGDHVWTDPIQYYIST